MQAFQKEYVEASLDSIPRKIRAMVQIRTPFCLPPAPRPHLWSNHPLSHPSAFFLATFLPQMPQQGPEKGKEEGNAELGILEAWREVV